MRAALFLPLFDGLADPLVVADLGAAAEEHGWDGVFVWDHVHWRAPVVDVADAWITLAALAGATERIRIGPMVTPLARRRPLKVARETVTLDRLSDGRLTLGVGLGDDRFGREFSATGEEEDERRRAAMLDESLGILTAAWSGEEVHHHGEHYTVDGLRFRPRPVQRPGIPVWVAGFPGKPRPLRRAARHDGFFPINLDHPDQLADIVDQLATLRQPAGHTDAAGAIDADAVDEGGTDGRSEGDSRASDVESSGGAGPELGAPFDVAVAMAPGADPTPFGAAGATWWMVEFPWDAVSVDQVRGIIRDGPAT